MRQRLISCISAVMLAVFVSYWVGITMFGHIHVVDGATIVHSHPGANAHNHSSKEIVTINAIASFLSDDVTPILEIVENPFPLVSTIISLYDHVSLSEPYHGLGILRAPPVH